MRITEKTISNLIESHFPFFFQEENPLLVEFVKKYFEWMETETANTIANVVVVDTGVGYSKNPIVTLTYANGSTSNVDISSRAVNGKVVDLFVDRIGNNYSTAPVIEVEDPISHAITPNTSGVNSSANTILLNSANSFFEARDRIYYRVPTGNVAIGGLAGNNYYFVSYVNSSALSLSLTAGGANINIEESRSGNSYSHYIKGRAASAHVNLNEINPGATLYHSRRLFDYKDVDTTVDKFLIYFKEKYLKNIQFDTAASTRRMIKHSLDLYRAKGTPRAIDLLFKVVFDTPAEIYLPSRDIFKLSGGDFYQFKYLEVTPTALNIMFVGKEITGVQSGAKAFVEKLVRKKIKGVYVEVFTISMSPSISTRFITGEMISIPGQISIKDNPKIIGSLTNVKVFDGSSDFTIGDVVDIESTLGIGAKGRVTSVSDVTGQVDFELVDRGFGYSRNSNIYISEKVLSLTNVNSNSSTSYFTDYDILIAPQGRVEYITSSNTMFNIGDSLYTYYTNGAAKGYGTIQGVSGNSTAGYLYFTVRNGSLLSTGAGTVNAYYSSNTTASNIHSANIGPSGYEDQTVNAKIIGTSKVITLNYANSLPFTVFENVYQLNEVGLKSATGSLIRTTAGGLSGSLYISVNKGLFVKNKTIYGESSGRQADVTNIDIDLGIIITNQNGRFGFENEVGTFANGDIIRLYYANGEVRGTSEIQTVVDYGGYGNVFFSVVSGNMMFTDTTVNAYFATANTKSANIGNSGFTDLTKGQFFSNTGNYVYVDSQTNAVIKSISTGSGATFKFANSFGNEETIEINTDYVANSLIIQLNAADYMIKPTAVVNSSTIIADALNYGLLTIGQIKYLTAIDYGNEYNIAPIIKLDEPLISSYDKKDIIVNISSISGNFDVNEIVYQTFTGARGLVKSVNTTSLSIRLLNFENSFALSNTSSNTYILGTSRGTSASIDDIFIDQDSLPMGLNGIVTANVVTQTGSIKTMEIIDSGFGFNHNEVGTFTSKDGIRVGRVGILLGTRTSPEDERGHEGKSLGRYRDENGFLSSYKKIQDDKYYQEFSYEVRSSVSLDKYEAMLKQLLHVSGTRYFSAAVKSSLINVSSDIGSSPISLPAIVDPWVRGEYNYTVDRAPYNITANTTGVSNTAEVIKYQWANSIFRVGDLLYYNVPAGNTAIGGMTANSYYYVSFVNTSSMALSTTLGGSNINITESRVGVGQTHYIMFPGTATCDNATGYYSIQANSSGINNSINIILFALANTIFSVGDQIYYTVPAGNTAIGGLTANNNYYVTYVNSTAMAISSTLGGANVDIVEYREGTAEVHTIHSTSVNNSVTVTMDRVWL